MSDELQSARATLSKSRHDLLRRAHVVATGVGYKLTAGTRTPTLAVICSVTEKVPLARLAPADQVPSAIDGVPTDVVRTGPIRALASRTERHRPAPGGVSIGHRDITAGTLGCLVRKDGQRFILSNNHVLADSNAGRIGDPILQPGPYDGGRLPQDQIAELHDFVPIDFSGGASDCPFATAAAAVLNGLARLVGSDTRLRAMRTQAVDNRADAAIARPLNDADVTPEILDIGIPRGPAQGELGMAIRKSGRTTGLTTGEIVQVDVTVSVQYGGGRVALFTDQLMAGAMSQGGDSGSAVLDDGNRLVGLLFAGSDSSTIINRIEHVFAALGVTL